jgi:hypothetical protein
MPPELEVAGSNPAADVENKGIPKITGDRTIV